MTTANQPGNLRDAHVHLAEYGESLRLVPLADCVSVDDALQRLARAAAELPAGRWVRGAGLRIEGLRERRAPTAAELEEAGGGRCVVVRTFDHHALVVSSGVLRLAGIDDAMPDPAGGVIVREGGAATGHLLESACELVWRIIPAASDEEYRGWVVAALDDLSRRGFVEVHDMMSRERLVRTLRQIEREGKLGIEVWLYATPGCFDGVRAAAGEGAAQGSKVRFAGLKLFADGTLNSRTASMLTAFHDPIPGAERGKALLSREEIAAGLERARAAGAGLAVHAIGDAAVRTVLDAVERCGGGTARDRAPGLGAVRVEHAQFVDEADVGRFAALGVVCSPQPCHLLTDIEAVHRVMPHRAARAFALRDLVAAYERAGMSAEDWVWLGSDAPVVPPSPMDNVTAATLRARVAGGVSVAPEQAVGEDLVWRLMRSRARTLGA